MNNKLIAGCGLLIGLAVAKYLVDKEGVDMYSSFKFNHNFSEKQKKILYSHYDEFKQLISTEPDCFSTPYRKIISKKLLTGDYEYSDQRVIIRYRVKGDFKIHKYVILVGSLTEEN